MVYIKFYLFKGINYRSIYLEIPASITACQFYRKLGYDYKNGIDKIDDEGLYRLEKFR